MQLSVWHRPHLLVRMCYGGVVAVGWRRIHSGIDEKTLEIRAAALTTSNIGGAPMLAELLEQIPLEQEIGIRKCHDAIAARGAAAIVPLRAAMALRS